MSLIETEALERSYSLGHLAVKALDGVTLNIEQSEFVAITGPSGSGKSTFMNLLGCLDTPSAGTYRLDGMSVEDLDSDELASIRNRKIGFVFQNFNLLSRATALENVELPLLYSGVRAGHRIRRARERLAGLGMQDRLNFYPNHLSGGQQQRVAIARALVNDPILLLADEPTGSLDSQTSADIMATFRHLNREEGVTVVLITHEQEVARHADRVIAFRDGRIRADTGRPRPSSFSDRLGSSFGSATAVPDREYGLT